MFVRQGNDGLVQGVVMEIASIQKRLAMKAHQWCVERCDGGPDARKWARPVRWRGKTLSSADERLIPLSFKWNHTCASCGKSDVPLQVEHMQPKARGGTDRVSNLCLACELRKQKKGTKDIATFLKKKPELLARIVAQAKAPLKDAAAVNVTRWAWIERLKEFGLPVECWSGGLTKYNRTRRGLPKVHWLDAACVGCSSPEKIKAEGIMPLCIKATGHGCRQLCLMDRFGFPRTSPKAKRFQHVHRREERHGDPPPKRGGSPCRIFYGYDYAEVT